MENDENKEQREVLEKLYAFIGEQMKAGVDKETISEKLVEMGIDRSDATDLVERIYAEIAIAAQDEQSSASSIIPALFGGALAALGGGGLWGLIVIATGYVIGFMAWGIGLLSGYAVVLFTGGRKGAPLQAIAVFSSVLGIVVGKYITFFHFLKEELAKTYGEEVTSNVSIFSEQTIQFFIENLSSVMGGFDILWVIFAVITAWSIPKKRW